MSDMQHDERVAPEGLTPRDMADEIVVDGLLQHVHQRGAEHRKRRISRAMSAIDGAERGVLARFPGNFRRFARPLVALAAMITIVILVMQFGVPGESRAEAQLHSVIVASRAAEVLRYEVRIDGELNATIDSGAGGLLVVSHRPPWLKEAVFCGRDAQGDWAMNWDRRLVREQARQFWPPWSTDGQTHFVDSIDRLMENFTKGYDIANQTGADGGQEIIASRRERKGPYPHRVVITVNAMTSIAERIEFQWDRKGTDQNRGKGSMTFTRVHVESLPHGWFDAATHVK